MIFAGLFIIAAIALALIAGDMAIIESAAHARHHTTAGVLGAAAGAFALDAVVVGLISAIWYGIE